jgi:hypothetical protein
MLARMHSEIASGIDAVDEATVGATPYLADSDLVWVEELRSIEFTATAETATILDIERITTQQHVDEASQLLLEQRSLSLSLKERASRHLGPVARYEQWWERIAAEVERDTKRDLMT